MLGPSGETKGPLLKIAPEQSINWDCPMPTGRSGHPRQEGNQMPSVAVIYYWVTPLSQIWQLKGTIILLLSLLASVGQEFGKGCLVLAWGLPGRIS